MHAAARFLSATLLACALSWGAPAARAREPAPVVVELFTAQGCAACIEANAAVEHAAATPGVIALTYGVAYWDYLGWADTFARPEFAQRQRAYRIALKQRGVSTPQIVIDGRTPVSGAREPALEAAIAQASSKRDWPPQIEFRQDGDRVGVGSGRAPVGGAEVVAVTYTPGLQTVEVREGENRGQTVRHMNVVRRVARLGDWRGRPVLYAIPPARPGEAVAVLLQSKTDRRILSAATRR